ncbi:MAG: class I SAM-dependent methyltransferase [Nocardioides sp.]|nr:class I SAM-dependent methyltransferase [Nocardioides sp.]
MKASYVRALRLARTVLAATGLLGLLDRLVPRSRTALWVRSWFAVYDLADLVALDTPWWTFEAADRVEAFLAARPGARVFEWGSGASTVWLGARSGSVTSVEHDPDWARQMSEVLPANAALVLRGPGRGVGPHAVGSGKPGFAGLDFAAYVDEIDAVAGLLDLIVIDGRAREACLNRAVGRLSPGGLIVLDNVERARYRDALARHAGVEVLWTHGRTPALPYPTRTALVTQPAP